MVEDKGRAEKSSFKSEVGDWGADGVRETERRRYERRLCLH